MSNITASVLLNCLSSQSLDVVSQAIETSHQTTSPNPVIQVDSDDEKLELSTFRDARKSSHVPAKATKMDHQVSKSCPKFNSSRKDIVKDRNDHLSIGKHFETKRNHHSSSNGNKWKNLGMKPMTNPTQKEGEDREHKKNVNEEGWITPYRKVKKKGKIAYVPLNLIMKGKGKNNQNNEVHKRALNHHDNLCKSKPPTLPKQLTIEQMISRRKPPKHTKTSPQKAYSHPQSKHTLDLHVDKYLIKSSTTNKESSNNPLNNEDDPDCDSLVERDCHSSLLHDPIFNNDAGNEIHSWNEWNRVCLGGSVTIDLDLFMDGQDESHMEDGILFPSTMLSSPLPELHRSRPRGSETNKAVSLSFQNKCHQKENLKRRRSETPVDYPSGDDNLLVDSNPTPTKKQRKELSSYDLPEIGSYPLNTNDLHVPKTMSANSLVQYDSNTDSLSQRSSHNIEEVRALLDEECEMVNRNSVSLISDSIVEQKEPKGLNFHTKYGDQEHESANEYILGSIPLSSYSSQTKSCIEDDGMESRKHNELLEYLGASNCDILLSKTLDQKQDNNNQLPHIDISQVHPNSKSDMYCHYDDQETNIETQYSLESIDFAACTQVFPNRDTDCGTHFVNNSENHDDKKDNTMHKTVETFHLASTYEEPLPLENDEETCMDQYENQQSNLNDIAQLDDEDETQISTSPLEISSDRLMNGFHNESTSKCLPGKLDNTQDLLIGLIQCENDHHNDLGTCEAEDRDVKESAKEEILQNFNNKMQSGCEKSDQASNPGGNEKVDCVKGLIPSSDGTDQEVDSSKDHPSSKKDDGTKPNEDCKEVKRKSSRKKKRKVSCRRKNPRNDYQDYMEQSQHCGICKMEFGDDEVERNDQNTLIGPLPFHQFSAYMYVHLSCCLWSPEVYRESNSGKWKNIENAAIRGERLKCSVCKKRGATLGCAEPSCRKSFHYACLIKQEMKSHEKRFDDENFVVYCKQHCDAIQSLDSLEPSIQDSK